MYTIIATGSLIVHSARLGFVARDIDSLFEICCILQKSERIRQYKVVFEDIVLDNSFYGWKFEKWVKEFTY